MSEIVCIGLLASCVNRKYLDQIDSVRNTWCLDAKKLDIKVYAFCGSTKVEDDLDDPQIVYVSNLDNVQSATDKQWLGFKHMMDTHPSCAWFVMAGTDNYIFMDRLVAALVEIQERIDPKTKSVLLGGHDRHADIDTPMGSVHFFSGSFLVLSNAALCKLYPDLDKFHQDWVDKVGSTHSHLNPACDVALAYYTRQYGIEMVRMQGLYGCDWRGYHPTVSKCCDIDYSTAIALHQCNNRYDHYAVREYWNRPEYASLYSLWHRVASLDFVISKNLFDIGTEISSMHITGSISPYLACIVRGMVDSQARSGMCKRVYTRSTNLCTLYWMRLVEIIILDNSRIDLGEIADIEVIADNSRIDTVDLEFVHIQTNGQQIETRAKYLILVSDRPDYAVRIPRDYRLETRNKTCLILRK